MIGSLLRRKDALADKHLRVRRQRRLWQNVDNHSASGFQRVTEPSNSSRYTRHSFAFVLLPSPLLSFPAGRMTKRAFPTRGISLSNAANSGELIWSSANTIRSSLALIFSRSGAGS